MPEKPKLQKDILDQLWYGMYGAPGSPGLIERFENHLAGNGTKPNGKKPRRLEALTITIAATVGLQSIGLLDGIKALIMQWFVGGAG